MTGKADFTEEEWELVREGPPTAGLVALSASRGGSFRESWAIAKLYAEARKEHGASQLLDDLVADKPKTKRFHTPEEAEQEGLRRLSEAVALLEQKATPGEVAGYKHFTLDVAGRTAKAHKEKGEPASVSPSEREAIEKIAASLNPSSEV
jgi:hypothetical protein